MATKFLSRTPVGLALAPEADLAFGRAGTVQARPALANVIAVVGCDGTGKTTLVADLVATLQATRPVERRYMGLVSGEAGDRIKALPVVGELLEAYLARRVRRAQDMRKAVPGTFAAVVMFLFSAWRVGQLRRLRRAARNGMLVIADRYPQAEVPGFHYDGPGLAVGRATGWFARLLARREQRLYEGMAQHRPSLVLRLTIDADTAHARKSDHPIHELRDKIETMPRIGYNGARILEIDARQSYPEVRRAALRAINAAIAA